MSLSLSYNRSTGPCIKKFVLTLKYPIYFQSVNCIVKWILTRREQRCVNSKIYFCYAFKTCYRLPCIGIIASHVTLSSVLKIKSHLHISYITSFRPGLLDLSLHFSTDSRKMDQKKKNANFYLPSFQQHLNIMRSTYELLTI